MKYSLLLLLVMVSFSCDKEDDKKCYNCWVSNPIGSNPDAHNERVCLEPGEDIADWQYYDANGNQYQKSCTPE